MQIEVSKRAGEDRGRRLRSILTVLLVLLLIFQPTQTLLAGLEPSVEDEQHDTAAPYPFDPVFTALRHGPELRARGKALVDRSTGLPPLPTTPAISRLVILHRSIACSAELPESAAPRPTRPKLAVARAPPPARPYVTQPAA